MSLDTTQLRARLSARGYRQSWADKAKKSRGKKPVADPVMKRQEEQRILFEAAEARRKARLARWVNEYGNAARYVRVLAAEEPETYLVEPGLVDLDLEHLIRGLKLHELPKAVRMGLLLHTLHWIKEVHRRRTRSIDITPYKRLFSAKFVSSLDEARSAFELT